MKKLTAVLFAAVLYLLCACGEIAPDVASNETTSTADMTLSVTTKTSTPDAPTSKPAAPRKAIAPFKNYSISMAANNILFDSINMEFRDKRVPFTEKELAKLAECISLNVGWFDGESLADLPKFFPKLRHLEIGSSYHNYGIAREFYQSIAELGLRALTIRADSAIEPKLFANLLYLNITSGVNDNGKPKDLKLSQHSVLGEKYISEHTDGVLIEYLRVNYGGRVYELFVKAPAIGINEDSGEEYHKVETEAWLFICKKEGQGYTCADSYGPLSRYAYYNGIRGGLVLADANFDGLEDILVLNMVEGMESRPYFHALLQQPNGKYRLCESFGMISKPELNAEKKTVRGGYRGGAGVYDWQLYTYKDNKFVQTKNLHRNFVEYKDVNNPKEEINRHTVEKIAPDGRRYDEKEYLSSDYSEAQWNKMFYDDSNEWALASDKWLYLYGMNLDVINSPVPVMVMKIIKQ